MDGSAVSTTSYNRPSRTRVSASVLLAAVVSALLVVATVASPLRASAAIVETVDLGTAETYSVLAGQTVTNTGPSVLDGDVGVSPGTAVVGFPPGFTGGVRHAGDAEALQAQSDLTIAYNDAAGRAVNEDLAVELGGQRLIGGVYKVSSAAEITGTLTLDGQGNEDSVFIFQVPSSLITASNSTVSLVNGASSCNVFWQVGSSATIGTSSEFVGTVMALTSVSVQSGSTVAGRALARNGAVTLDNNVFTSLDCISGADESPSPSPSTSTSPSTSPSPSTPTSPTGAPTATESESATESPSPSPTRTVTTPGPTITESDFATESPSAPQSVVTTESDFATEATSTSTNGTLAATGSNGMTTVAIFGGVMIVILGATLLALARTRRPGHRH